MNEKHYIFGTMRGWDFNQSKCRIFLSVPLRDLVNSTLNGLVVKNFIKNFLIPLTTVTCRWASCNCSVCNANQCIKVPYFYGRLRLRIQIIQFEELWLWFQLQNPIIFFKWLWLQLWWNMAFLFILSSNCRTKYGILIDSNSCSRAQCYILKDITLTSALESGKTFERF